jgi:predicted dehydrogenase
MEKVRFGFIGAGSIAKKALYPALMNSSVGEIYAVAGKDADRAKALSPSGKFYTDYQELIDDPKVEAVYISLPNSLHIPWSIKAMQAGKHVLCEKPFSMNLNEALLMFDCAKKNNRLLAEAIWFRWHPRFRRIVDIVEKGTIGSISSIETSFTFYGEIKDNYRSYPEMGGGSLFDVGPYQLHVYAALVKNRNMFKVSVNKQYISPSGIDLTSTWLAQFGDSILLKGHSSFKEPNHQKLIITGSYGSIEAIGNDAFTSWNCESVLRVNNTEQLFKPINAYQLMIENFGSRIKNEAAWLPEINDTLWVMQALDLIQANATNDNEN